MEKYARQAVSEGLQRSEDIHVNKDSEIYRVLNLHYNRNNHIEVSDWPLIIYDSNNDNNNIIRWFFLNHHRIPFLFILFSLLRRLLAISSTWSNRRYASFSWPSKTARTRNSRGKSPFTKWFRAWTTPSRSTSGLRISSNSSNKRCVYICIICIHVYTRKEENYACIYTYYILCIRRRVCKLCFFFHV